MYRQSEKLSKRQYLLHLRIILNCGLLTAEICWRVWGTPENFNGFRVLASLLQRRRSTEVNQTLHKLCTMFGRFLAWYTVHTFSAALAA